MASRSPTAYAPGLSDEKVLRAIGRYHYLKREQLTRLLFSPASETYTSEILTRLTRQHYLERTVLPRESEFGRGKSLWSLMGRGRSYLEGLGISLLPRVSHTAVRSYTHLKHLLAVNDTLIACEVFARDEPGVDLADFVHERVFHRTPERVDLLLAGKKLPNVPVAADGWVHLQNGDKHAYFWLEADRSTEHGHLWLRKIAGIVEFYESGAYQERFDADQITVMVVAIPDAGIDPVRRRDELKRWTEQTLERLGRQDAWTDIFKFSAVDPASVTPREFFYGQHWTTPFVEGPGWLLEGAG